MTTLDKSAFNPVIGAPPTLEWVAVASIGIDASYQRSIDNEASQRFIRAIARDWDWSLCLPLKMSRREDGSVWAVDGQHRHAAATLRGDIPHLPCVIGRYRGSADEAAAFVALNRSRRPLNGTELFKAGLVAGDAGAIEVMATIKAAGLRLAPHSNYTTWKPGMIFCIPGVQKAFRQRGPVPTLRALKTLAIAFDGQVLRYAGLLLDGLYDVYSGAGRAGDFDLSQFASIIGVISQDRWVKRAMELQSREGVSRAAAMALSMLDCRDVELGRPRRTPRSAAPAAVAPVPAAAPVAAASRPTPAPKRTFEETLALVEAGKITVSAKPAMIKAEPDGLYASGLA